MPEIYQKALKAQETATFESREVIQKLTELNQKLVKDNAKLLEDITKVKDELELTTYQNHTQDLLKKDLIEEMSTLKKSLAEKDQVILDLEDQVKKQKVKLQDNKGQKMLEEKIREMEMIKEEMKDVMLYKNEIFDLKAKVAELHEEIIRKDAERELGQQMNLEDTSLVKSLRKDLTQCEKDLEDSRSELSHTKFALDEQVKNFENFELQTRNLKRDNKIFSKIMGIEIRSPQMILDDYRSGKTKEKHILSGVSNSVNSPYPSYSYRAVSQYNLDIDSNIY